MKSQCPCTAHSISQKHAQFVLQVSKFMAFFLLWTCVHQIVELCFFSTSVELFWVSPISERGEEEQNQASRSTALQSSWWFSWSSACSKSVCCGSLSPCPLQARGKAAWGSPMPRPQLLLLLLKRYTLLIPNGRHFCLLFISNLLKCIYNAVIWWFWIKSIHKYSKLCRLSHQKYSRILWISVVFLFRQFTLLCHVASKSDVRATGAEVWHCQNSLSQALCP